MSFLPIRRTQPLEVRDPFVEFQNDVSQLFSRMSKLWGDNGIFSYSPLATPALDIEEDDKNYYMRLDVPGVTAQDINLSVDEHTLVLSGERDAEHRSESRRSVATERIYGRFYREITLPVDADVDHLHASLKHGVLTVTMPKLATTTRRSIPIDNT